MGASHSSELPLLFGTHALYRGNSSELEWATSEAMQDAWLAFASGGVESVVEEVGWPLYHNESGMVRHFGDILPTADGNVQDLDLQCSLQLEG